MMDIATCAMAFRLLRMNGYDVSSGTSELTSLEFQTKLVFSLTLAKLMCYFTSDELSHVAGPSNFHDSLHGYLNDTKSLLELYKASKVSLSENDLILDGIGSWSGNLLKDKLCSSRVQKDLIFGEVLHKI
jgi:ent-kaurene synthase